MIEAHICSNVSGIWTGRLFDESIPIWDGQTWTASSRSELISLMKRSIPLKHINFVDKLEPTDP